MTISIQPHEIETLLDRYPAAQVLSLDCFDTLIWRDTHAPSDVFHALPGIGAAQRAGAESKARKAQDLAGKGTEVSIAQIYQRLMPNASADSRSAAISAELLAEARHCYAFAPTVRLMQAAREKGLEIIIVSDTYLDEEQLLSLIAGSAGEDVAGLIDRVFCSSTHGKSKAGGLYSHVMRKLKCAPETIVHLGDNFGADVEGVAPFGVTAVHLNQWNDAARPRMRLEAGVDAMTHTQDGKDAPALMPHRAAMALGEPQLDDPAAALGASLLGPVLHAYDRWLRTEAEALAETHGGTVHWLFLMRDGHLPQLVHQQRGGLPSAHAAEISRFTATAAHFTDDAAIAAYVEEELGQRPQTLARQLLMPETRVESLLEPLTLEEGSLALLKETRSGPFRKAARRASRGFADRLEAHVRKVCNPQQGDVLMLVDLGYNGSVQNRVDHILADRLGVHVAGRYLLLREMNCPGLDKKGLIDARHYDARVLEAMCANVALLEQLCTKAQGSVVDYHPDGTPIRSTNDIKQQQSEVRERVQAGCLAFQDWADSAMLRTGRSEAEMAALWRKSAASVLMRSMFLPLPHELQVVSQFQHDVNLGTERTVPLFDREIARDGLRQRGLFYMNGAERMYLPAEIDGEGMATRLSLLAHRRFNLPFTFADCAGTPIDLPVIFADAERAVQRVVTASPTHDGYYTAAIPIGDCRFAVAPQLGALFEWVELDHCAFLPVADFVSGKHEELRRELAAKPKFDGISRASPRLLHCHSASGQMLLPPPEKEEDGQPMLLAITFRPLVRREIAAAAAHTTEERAA